MDARPPVERRRLQDITRDGLAFPALTPEGLTPARGIRVDARTAERQAAYRAMRAAGGVAAAETAVPARSATWAVRLEFVLLGLVAAAALAVGAWWMIDRGGQVAEREATRWLEREDLPRR